MPDWGDETEVCNRQKALRDEREPSGMPLDALAHEARWVAWRNELRGGKPTKVPYAPDGMKAKADNPSTWGTRKVAEACASRIVNGQGGGIGIQLGDLGGDMHLCGIDLDSCLSRPQNQPTESAGSVVTILGAP
jgi:primase-polymerase (primpol)-like protein